MRETAEASGPRKAAGDKASRSLSIAALLFVALAAVMGWGASFVGLHEYGMQSMAGFSYWSAWLVPATFDGAAFACTLMTYRSSINGRSALRGRILMWAFTAVSSWINWIHQPSPQAQIVAAGLPIAAVAVFDVVLLELRADYEARHGKRGFRLRPGLLLLRWMVDRASTRDAFRKQVIDIPVEEIAGLGPVGHPGPDYDEDEYPAAVVSAPRDERDFPRNGHAPAVRDERASFHDTRTSSSPEPPVPPVRVTADSSQNGHAPSATTAVPAEPRTARAQAVDPETTRIPLQFAAAPADERPAELPDRPVPAAEIDEDRETAGAVEPADEPAKLVEPVEPAERAVEPANPTEQTVTLPPIPERPMTDEEKRAAARQDYRLSLETEQPANGAQLAKRYGMSDRWGRNQIAAVREEMRREQHPRLVAVDGN